MPIWVFMYLTLQAVLKVLMLFSPIRCNKQQGLPVDGIEHRKKYWASVHVRGLPTNAWCASLDPQGLVDRGPEETPLPLLLLICKPTTQPVINPARAFC